jgi:hypothetical protein
MISDASSKIIRNKHASIHTLLAVKGSEGACISELWASLIGIGDKRDSHQGTTLIVHRIFFIIDKQKWSAEPLKKTRRNPKSHKSRENLNLLNNGMATLVQVCDYRINYCDC